MAPGYAVAAYGHPGSRKTSTCGCGLTSRTPTRLVSALDDFGFGSLGLTAADFIEEGIVVQLGYPPQRIDILTQVDGVQFDSCWDRHIEIEIGSQRVPFISADDQPRTR